MVAKGIDAASRWIWTADKNAHDHVWCRYVIPAPPVTGELCDDGNIISGDGCDSTCIPEFCGDGIVNNAQNGVVTERCDDENTVDCDGCNAQCMPEACGNGILECTEQCDDGNTASCDLCNASC
eukprot:gene12804-biopygen8755